MKVYSGALVATLALSLWGAAAGDCMANRGQRVRGLVEEVELPRKNRRLMVTNVGGSGGGWMWSPGSGSGDLDTKAPSPAPVRPPNGSGGGGGGGGGSNGPTGGGGGSSGPIIIPEASGTRGRMKDRRMMRGRMRGKGGRSIRGSMGGFRGGGSRGGRTEGACTCMSCTTDVLNTKAGDFTCGTRIDFLLKNRSQDYPTTASACYHVAGIEFPDGTYFASHMVTCRIAFVTRALSFLQSVEPAIPSHATVEQNPTRMRPAGKSKVPGFPCQRKESLHSLTDALFWVLADAKLVRRKLGTLMPMVRSSRGRISCMQRRRSLHP